MIVYFADRQLNILGTASTELPNGLNVHKDKKTEDVETGVAVFECKIPFTKKTRSKVEACTEVGNYVLRSHDSENEFFTIIDSEIDTKNQEVYIYAEDAGLDLLNEIVGAYEADQAYSISHYINTFAADSGFQIGINEASNLTRKLSWDGESTVTERIASVATQFGGFEVSYSFDIKGLEIKNKYINIYQERGQDNGVQLRLNRDIDRIVAVKSIANLATALECTGGVPENKEEPITLKGYSYDDGDFYVSGSRLYSREALKKWSRYNWAKEPNQLEDGKGHIVKMFSYETTEQATLCAHAVAELKKICEIEVNYEVDIVKLPEGTKIGDWVNIVDDEGELYVAGRILKLTTSVAEQEQSVVLGEYLIKSSEISQKVALLAEQFAKASASAARALGIATNAADVATTAQAAAAAAQLEAETARREIEELANSLAGAAQVAADDAEETANAAMEAVRSVILKVAGLETTVNNAQEAANGAQLAADTAQEMAGNAAQAAADALADAADAKAAAELAQNAATTATTKAETAKSTADTAKVEAETAQATADAAKQDALKAQQDIAALGDDLETVSNTMTADYARKTELTEAAASLQSQITQNAGEISSTVALLATVDETANNAQEQAQAAQSVANSAKSQADKATADAEAAQTAADNAAAAATAAQNEADTAKAAAAAAQSVADKAEADLKAAKDDLATVTSRVDATEEEIIAAQNAVQAAQTAAVEAQEIASTATEKATEAQERAANAVTNATNAQAAANDAASKATLAQKVADEAKGDASAAVAKADEAAAAAADAQRTASSAVSTATAAQTRADEVAQVAADAQTRANDAKAKADKAAEDLATAEQNLADVSSRVGATEADIEAAQAAVEAAQAAAGTAHEEAEAAQATANTAKANAATAQTAANNAKAAAGAAQAAADDAQQAAEDAQAAVDALAVRVTTAETKITQNSQQIALMATKTEVAQTLGGYYTKAQTDAAIKVKADEITSSVSNQIKAVKIGGRNLLRGTDFGREPKRYERLEGYTTEGGFHFVPTVQIENGTEYTLSAKIRGNANIVFYEIREGGNKANFWIGRDSLSETEYNLFSKTFIVDAGTVFKDAYICTQWGDANTLVGDWFEIEPDSLKLEKGNKVTDWTPAPEDVSDGINSAQNTADDAKASIETAETIIQQLANSIASLVRDGNGGSLIKQDSSGFYYFDISEIENGLSDTANSANDLEGVVLDASGQIDVLKSTVEALRARTEYVRSYTDANGQPCLELGEGDSAFKVRITNTEIQFAEGTAVPARMNRQMLIIEKAMVRNELQFGDDEEVADGVWIWKRRSNGNLGLMWRGVDS